MRTLFGMTCPAKNVAFSVTEISSHVEKVFCLFYVTCDSTPRTVVAAHPSKHCIAVNDDVNKLGMVAMLFCSRRNDENAIVSQFLGSAVLDLSVTECVSYPLKMMDCSARPPVHTGTCIIKMHRVPDVPTPLIFQTKNVPSLMFNAAEANLKWISPFNTRGLKGVIKGLKMVHSPYYVNHMGITLPSGAFCLIGTSNGKRADGIRSHRQRLVVSLKRNHISEHDFVRIVADMMDNGVRSKHLRCLTVVADALTLHARTLINYSPDVVMEDGPRGTERWEVPREPTVDGSTSFTGDCEDFAREVYQQAKEIVQWVLPRIDGDALQAASAVLHMYVPTIEQGAVDSEAVSTYQRKIRPTVAYRNHMWAALHPRHAFMTKCRPSMGLHFEKWDKQACEAKLPMIHLEGTGDVFPIVTHVTPGYIARIQHKRETVLHEYPELDQCSTPDFSLQTLHHSDFYKYAIACMTDVFADVGILDFTYISGNKYGVSIYDWARGKYRLRPSTKHSAERMNDIRELMTLERPIDALTTKCKCLHTEVPDNVDCVRFGSLRPHTTIPPGAKQGVYKIGDKILYEIYFDVGFNTISSESE